MKTTASPTRKRTAPTPPGYDLLKQASWIWPEGYMYLHNHYAQFRHDFDLPKTLDKLPKKTPLYITADKEYRLYINGQYVCRGPARGYQSHWPYDEVDVRAYLKAGKNWISVEAYTPGISTFKYLHYTKAGMLCAADWGAVKIFSGNHWLKRRSPAHSTDTARLSMQLDFQEHIDAAADDRSWINSSDEPKGWNKNYFENGQNVNSFPFGQPPYDDVEPRGIPQLREDLIVPQAVTAEGIGTNHPDYKTCTNVSWHWMGNEFSTVKTWSDGASVACTKHENDLELVLQPAGDNQFRAVTIDLGMIMPGTLNLAVDGACGNEILDIHYHQTLRKGYPEYLKPGDACHVAFASRLKTAKGNYSHEFFQAMGIRHITIVGRDLTKPLTLRLAWRTAVYPLTMGGSFTCSDETLNSIYKACKHTQQICATDAYVDTPWREQAQWWGDARVQARNTFYIDGDARLLARGIRSIAGQRAPQGLTYGHAPTCSGWCILPDFSLTWVMTIWDYYWQTGDISVFKEQKERVDEIFAYFESDAARREDGLLIYDKRFWLFEDWAPLPKNVVPTFLNLWHLYTLEHYAKMLAAAGMKKEATACKAVNAKRRTLLINKLFNKKDGLFIAGFNEKGKPSAPASVHDQVLACLLQLTPKGTEPMLKKLMLPHVHEKKIAGAEPSAFWSTYLFDALLQLGHGQDVIPFLRKKWEPMLSTGSTWEGYDWNESAGGTCSHAWSAHPSYHLVNIIAGITQTDVAWKSVKWSPVFVSGMANAEATIPTPLGKLTAGWKLLSPATKKEGATYTLNLTLPKGIKLQLDLPGLCKTISKSGSYSFEYRNC